ncbi:phasin family protein [Filobacillus milosensis]|nr:phasin family protein [Filobacillus milosensis]
MKDTFIKGMSIGLGLAAASKEQVDKVMEELNEKGQLTKEESNSILNELQTKGEQRQQELDRKVQTQIKKYLDELEVPSKEDFQSLEKRVNKLENQLNNEE